MSNYEKAKDLIEFARLYIGQADATAADYLYKAADILQKQHLVVKLQTIPREPRLTASIWVAEQAQKK